MFFTCVLYMHACRTCLVYLRYYWWLAYIKKQSGNFSRPLGQVLSTNIQAPVWLTGMDRNTFYIRMLYTCVKFSTCLSVVLTNCQTSGDEKVAVYFLKKRDLCEYLTILHFSLSRKCSYLFFSFPLEANNFSWSRLFYFQDFNSFFLYFANDL